MHGFRARLRRDRLDAPPLAAVDLKTVVEHCGLTLVAGCLPCSRNVALDADALAARFGWAVPVTEIRRRLRCRRCGNRTPRLLLGFWPDRAGNGRCARPAPDAALALSRCRPTPRKRRDTEAVQRMRPHPERRQILERALNCRLHPPWRTWAAPPRASRQADHARAAQETRAFVATVRISGGVHEIGRDPSLCLPTTPCRTSRPSSARQTVPVGVDLFCASGGTEHLVDAVPRARVLGSRDALRKRTELATMTDENDKRRVLHLYHVEMLYAAVVEAFIEWQTAIVEAVIRAALSDATPPCLRAHERCTAKLASLLQLATSYREGREWRCECHHCNFMCGLRNYLTHHWTTGRQGTSRSRGLAGGGSASGRTGTSAATRTPIPRA